VLWDVVPCNLVDGHKCFGGSCCTHLLGRRVIHVKDGGIRLLQNLNAYLRNYKASQQAESESHVTTDGQSTSLSWNKAPIWVLRPDFYFSLTVAFCWCGAPSVTRGRVCRLQLLLVLASAVILGSEFRGSRDHILLSQIRDFPFRCLLRLAGLRWRYSIPPPHGRLTYRQCFYSYSGGTRIESQPGHKVLIFLSLSLVPR
jgi:hypothetical protein